MSLPVIIDMEAFDRIDAVSNLYAQGVTSPYAIGRRLGIKMVEAKSAIAQWHEILRDDSESTDAARDALNVMLKRYDDLLERANQNYNNLLSLDYDEKVSAQINTTLKVIGDLDAKRVDLMQKAGLLDASDLGDELAEREAREAMIIGILRNDICHTCKIVVRDKITELTGTVEGQVVDV